MQLQEQAEQFNTLLEYLSLRHLEAPTRSEIGAQPGAQYQADLIVLCGNTCLQSAWLARDLLLSGAGRHLIIAGGYGHATPPLFENILAHPEYRHIPTGTRSEAEVLLDLINSTQQKPLQEIYLETRSTNCGENAAFALASAREAGLPHQSVLILQDPVMQHRTHMHFQRHWGPVKNAALFSYAAIQPRVTVQGDTLCFANPEHAYCNFDRFLLLIFGEMHRLIDNEFGYGPRGKNFIDHVEVPPAVLSAFEELSAFHPTISGRHVSRV